MVWGDIIFGEYLIRRWHCWGVERRRRHRFGKILTTAKPAGERVQGLDTIPGSPVSHPMQVAHDKRTVQILFPVRDGLTVIQHSACRNKL